MNTTLAEIFGHNHWANLRLLETCRQLTSEQLTTELHGTFGQLGPTIVHIVRAESWYVSVLTGWEPPVRWELSDPFPGIDALAERAEFTGRRLAELAADDDGERIIEIRRRSGVQRLPAWVLMLQAIDHAGEHRSQVSTMLTQLGIEPPSSDGWQYAEETLPTTGE